MIKMIIKETDLKKLNDGLLNYFYFFQEPNLGDIKTNKKEINVSGRYKGDLVEKIKNLKPDEFIYIDQPILPIVKKNGQRVRITPDEFDKKYKELKIKIPRTKKEAIVNKSDPQRLILNQIKQKKEPEIYRGYGWRPESDNIFRLIPLSMIFKGIEALYFFSPDIYKKSENKNAEKLYSYLSKFFDNNGSDYKIHSKDYGKNAILYVPSLSKDNMYKLKIEHIPLNKSNNKIN